VRRRAAVGLVFGPAAVALLLVWPEAPPRADGAWLRAAGLAPRFETLDGVRVRYLRAGTGTPVVLLHGFASSVYTWKDVLPALARRHDVLALDLPGFGASDQPLDLSAELYPKVVAGLMDRLGLGRSALVGNSMGAAVAVQLAATSPDRVDRLVLIDAAGFNLAQADRPALLRLALSAAGVALFERLPLRRTAVRLGLRQVFEDRALLTDERVEEYLAPLARPGALRSMRSLALSRGQDWSIFPSLAARVRVPTLILWGAADRWIPLAQADRFASAIPGSRKVVLPACGHVPQEERPDEVLRLLVEFLGDGAPG
jgi:4,5:9,10-diseco-3-hydroxy-5,9,17-trioxoandrosta-1(10),2-diene-4-oate hydrolase